jgi:hypothetical protein
MNEPTISFAKSDFKEISVIFKQARKNIIQKKLERIKQFILEEKLILTELPSNGEKLTNWYNENYNSQLANIDLYVYVRQNNDVIKLIDDFFNIVDSQFTIAATISSLNYTMPSETFSFILKNKD